MRLKKLAQLLTKTSLPIYKLSAQCGFKEPNYAKRAFKKAFGTSMREFRSSH
jgi:transcriptional regulator GlxA family with amidase domain